MGLAAEDLLAIEVLQRFLCDESSQIGMFSYTGLTVPQVEYCREKGSVFMLDTGRVSMAGLNDGNVERVAKVMAEAIKATE